MPRLGHAPATSPIVSIVSGEPREQVAPLVSQLVRRGVVAELVSAQVLAAREASFAYIRQLDPALLNPPSVATLLTDGEDHATVNSPQSVRACEWAPLAAHALTAAGVPHVGRAWCVNGHDVLRAGHAIGLPLLLRPVVPGPPLAVCDARALADAAVAVETGAHALGLMAEPLDDGAPFGVTVLVVEGRPVEFRFDPGSSLLEVASDAVGQAAVAAAEAVGAAVLDVHVTPAENGVPVVDRLDAAPDLDALGRRGVDAIADAICARMPRNGSGRVGADAPREAA
jgi:hypothetical protein